MKKNKFIALFTFCLFSATLSLQAQNFTQADKVVASDRQANDNFGYSTDVSGNYAIVGARNEDGSTFNQGAAYIYERNSNGDWVEKQKLIASDAAAFDQFGFSVAIDGNYAVVGAHLEDEDVLGNGTIANTGSAYIFERNTNGTWVEIQKIVASNRAWQVRFGFSVDIDNDFILVGTGVDARYAYIFKQQSNGTWLEEQMLVGPNPGPQLTEYYATSVSLEGNLCIIGAQGANEDANGNNPMPQAGAAYIYERNSSGVWSLNQKIVAPDRDIEDFFGSGVSISGNEVVVGAMWEDHDVNGNNFVDKSGSAYLFERNASGQWNFTQKITSSTRGTPNIFGSSVALENNFLIVGSSGGNSSQGGNSAYIFEKTGGVWSQLQRLQPQAPSTPVGFGGTVSLSGDYFFIGDEADETDELGGNPLNIAGSAYFFEPACPDMEVVFSTNTTLCDGNITVSATASTSAGTAPFTYYWSNNTNAATTSDLETGSYTVDIVDANGCSVTGDLEISPEHFADIDLTLVHSDCGRKDLDPYDAVLTYYTANIASSYHVYVEGPGVSYVLTVNNFNQFNLGDIPGVEPAQTYVVRIAALIDGVWTDFGTPCEIHTAEQSTVNLKLLCDYCGKANFDLSGSQIYFETRPDASDYKIRINGPGVPNQTIGVTGDYFFLAQIPGIQYNATYTIEVGALVNGVWMGFGTPCEISTDALPPIYLSRSSGKEISSIENNFAINGPEPIGSLKVYPNPSINGTSFIHYESKNAAEQTSALLNISTLQGKTLLSRNVKLNEGELTFALGKEISLIEGIYLITIQQGSEVFTQKLIVQ